MQNECVFRNQKLTEKLHIVSGCPFKCWNTGRERLIRSHSSARFSFELSGNSN